MIFFPFPDGVKKHSDSHKPEARPFPWDPISLIPAQWGRHMLPRSKTRWWFGTCLIFPSIGNVIFPTDFHVFQRGGSTTNQINIWWDIVGWRGIWLYHTSPVSVATAPWPWSTYVNGVCSRVIHKLAYFKLFMGGNDRNLPRWICLKNLGCRKISWWITMFIP